MWYRAFYSILVLVSPSLCASAHGAPSLQAFSKQLASLSETISPSVVQVLGTGLTPVNESGERVLLGEERRVGSGLIVTRDGYIVTNAHVVADAQRLWVRLSPIYTRAGRERVSILDNVGAALPATLIGFDQETDVAVLKVAAKDLRPAPWGDSDKVRRGHVVMAFGSPLGLEGSMSMGVVSAVARQMSPENPMIYIQTDAPINTGNSGGPLVSVRGEVVGINSFIISESGGSDGIGFAIPSEIVRTVYRQLREHGRVIRGVIGVQTQTITPVLARALHLSVDYGVIISDVLKDGPAERAGIAVGDVILTLQGEPLENGRQFDVSVYHYSIGEEVTLEVLRGRKTHKVKVRVTLRTDDFVPNPSRIDPVNNLVMELGVLVVETLERGTAHQEAKLGVMVAGFAPTTGVHGRAFMIGDVIHSINRVPITSVEQLRTYTQKLENGEPLAVHVRRKDRMLFLPLTVDRDR